MADPESGLRFCFDYNWRQDTADLLRRVNASEHHQIAHLQELDILPNAPDEAWMAQLGKRGRFAVITRDGEILQAAIRRDAWRKSRITLFLFDKRWGQLPMFHLFRGLIFWWPAIVQYAEASAEGTAWTVSLNVPSWNKGSIRPVRPPEDTGPVA